MPPKSHVDAFGIISLTGFALLLGFNQVVIKVTNDGLQPVFFAALRSLGGAVLIYAWIRWRRIDLTLPRSTWGAGVLIGTVFASEFICLFLALDLTTVTRTSVLLYTMPIWLALAAHVLIPGERLTVVKSIGLALAFAGVVVALVSRGGSGGEATLAGDLLALVAAIFWAGIALIVRTTALKTVSPEVQLCGNWWSRRRSCCWRPCSSARSCAIPRRSTGRGWASRSWPWSRRGSCSGSGF
jgi:drug/metabolite transporter (DMT)-like permease